MRAIVLVGGFGTRLRPLTSSTPKQMLSVAGRPMIERVVAHLARHGIDEVVLSLGFRPEVFTDAYPDGTCAGVPLVCAAEPEPLDTAGGIAFAARAAGIQDRFLVVNGDAMTELDISALIAFHRSVGAEGTIALTRVKDPSHFGVVPTDDGGRVLAFVEKPPPGEAPTDLINAGYYVLEPSVVDRIPSGERVNIERTTFPAMVEDGSLFGRPDPGWWLDVGTPDRYIEANVHYAGTSTVIEAGAEVAVDAVVEGSVVSSGARIESGAVVRGSIIGAGASVGAGAKVEAGSVVGPGARVAPGATLVGQRLPDPEG
ncbi:MAG TPA: NDP-sugar synthase [Acidimicrobiales bacterium]